MRRGRRGVAAAVGAIALAGVAGCGSSSVDTAERGCARSVLGDWADGAIDRAYPDTCYVAAIDALPEDMRVYTTAADDIRRAMLAQRQPVDGSRLLAGSFATESEQPNPDEVPWAVLGLAAVAGAVGAAGATAFLVRRRRRAS